jgi:hypothetical protein
VLRCLLQHRPTAIHGLGQHGKSHRTARELGLREADQIEEIILSIMETVAESSGEESET